MEIEWFATAEEAEDRLAQAMKAADARVQPWQVEDAPWRAAIKPGDCFVMASGDGFLIFGEVLEEGEPGRSKTRLWRAAALSLLPLLFGGVPRRGAGRRARVGARAPDQPGAV